MALALSTDTPCVRDRVSPEEWQTRVDLAACYRLVAHFGWIDLIYNHISARVPGPEEHFLLNPYGFMFEEVTASSLVKIDLDGNVVMDTPFEVNAAGFTIHSAVHMARPDVACVIHTHTHAGMAVSAQEDGLLPLTQNALMFHGDRLAYHDYEGIAFDLTERERLIADLGDRFAMILRNHGLLACGRTIPEAFEILQNLEHACAAQIAAQAGGGPLITPSEAVCRHTADQFWSSTGDRGYGVRAWPAMLRLMNRHNPGYDV
ncbi:MAG: class II aldolase/adducin family protein [Alphaproteobacteria bacterium]|nr:class II aldolase/adducin family protein [Alphaproteobacteria bacterium]